MAGTAKKKTRAEQGLEKKRKENERNKLKNLAANEMGEFPYKKINWKRRLRAKNDLCYFAQTYFYNVLTNRWQTTIGHLRRASGMWSKTAEIRRSCCFAAEERRCGAWPVLSMACCMDTPGGSFS